MSFLPVFREALHIGDVAAPAVGTALNPATGALIGMVIDSVTKAEEAGATGQACGIPGQPTQIGQRRTR